MKAEDFLHSKEIYQATCLTNKSTYYLKDLVSLLDDYARIQIEKDREDCSENVPINKLWSDDRKAVKDFIINRPINLES